MLINMHFPLKVQDKNALCRYFRFCLSMLVYAAIIKTKQTQDLRRLTNKSPFSFNLYEINTLHGTYINLQGVLLSSH